MIKIYHNPRCSKSREALKFLEDKNVDFEVIEYLKLKIEKEELTSIIKKLKLDSPLDLIRTNEKIWKEEFKNKTLSEDDLIDAMIANPKLIQRPIIIKGDSAVIGRPCEKITTIL